MFVVEPSVFEDEMGHLMETYQENDFRDAGYELRFICTTSHSQQGEFLRGLHIQTNYSQGKLVRVIEDRNLTLELISGEIQKPTTNGTVKYYPKTTRNNHIFRRALAQIFGAIR